MLYDEAAKGYKEKDAINNAGPAIPGGRGGHAPPPPLFCVAKRKKGEKGKKERVSKQKLSKGCLQGQNIVVLAILERLEFENFSDNTCQCSIFLTILANVVY